MRHARRTRSLLPQTQSSMPRWAAKALAYLAGRAAQLKVRTGEETRLSKAACWPFLWLSGAEHGL